MRRILLILAGLAAIPAAALLAAMLLDTEIRQPPENVPGYQVMRIPMPHREQDIEVHIWYPTSETGASELIGQNALFYGFYANPDARPMAVSAPIVLLSHGSGGNAVRLGWLATELAAKGMIVVAPNHPGITSRDSSPFETVKIWQRPQDLSAVLDFLQQTPPEWLKADFSRVAVVGFSLGGQSALSLSGAKVTKQGFIAYCDQNPDMPDCKWLAKGGVDFTQIDQALYEQSGLDARITAAVAIDPTLPLAMTDESLTQMTSPILVINLGTTSEVPLAVRADRIATLMPQATYQSIPGATHFSFLAECSVLGRIIIGLTGEENICADPGGRDRAAIHADLNGLISDFLTGQFALD